MAIKIGNQVVVSDTRVLTGITGTDGTTQASVNTAIKNQDNILRIFDSTGTEIRTLYCAKT